MTATGRRRFQPALRDGLLALGLALPAAAGAHEAAADGSWRMDAWLVLLLAASIVLYLVGLVSLWRRAGRGRGISRARAAAFVAGWGVTLAALLPPIDPLGKQLFSAHMIQHELLMALAAPLLVLGRPFVCWSHAWPAAARAIAAAFRRPLPAAGWRTLTDPMVAWWLHAAALWLWHLPIAFEAALTSDGWHELQHASFFITALLFWWPLLGRDSRQSQGAALVYLFTTMLHTGMLGALFALSSQVWYPTYAHRAAELGIDALADQQLGGLLMWVPAGVAYIAAAMVIAMRLLAPRGAAASAVD